MTIAAIDTYGALRGGAAAPGAVTMSLCLHQGHTRFGTEVLGTVHLGERYCILLSYVTFGPQFSLPLFSQSLPTTSPLPQEITILKRQMCLENGTQEPRAKVPATHP